MSLLTLVRHGQASYMAADYDKLSPMGEEQARKLGIFWARHGIVFDQAYHGPAQRHRRTMEIAADEVRKAGLPWPEPVLVQDVDEVDAYQIMKSMAPLLIQQDETVRRLNQEFLDGQQTPEAGRLLQRFFEAIAHRWCTGEYDTPDVETWAGFRQRVTGAIGEILARAPKSSSTVVFTSGGPIAATVSHVLDLHPSKAIELLWLSRNSSYSEFLSSDGRISLSSFNSFPHLDDKELLTYR